MHRYCRLRIHKIPIGENQKKLKEMRNEVFARHGYAFNDNEQSLLFSGKPWYKAKKDFNATMIPKEEQGTVVEI